MLTIKTITEQRDEVIRRLAVKHFDATEIIDRIIALDKTRRASQTALDANLTEVNRLSKQIGGLMKEGKRAEADEAKAEVSRLKETNRTLEADKTQAEKDMHELLVLIPNLPHASPPDGTGAPATPPRPGRGPSLRPRNLAGYPAFSLFIFRFLLSRVERKSIRPTNDPIGTSARRWEGPNFYRSAHIIWMEGALPPDPYILFLS